MAKMINLKTDFDLNKDDIFSSLRDGKLIVYPAETLYGLGCDFRLEEAVASLKKLKNRPDNKGFILLASSWEQIIDIGDIPEEHQETLKSRWPGGLTAILKPKNVPEWMVYEGGIAVRITSNPLSAKFIESYGSPLITTSINTSGDEPLTDIKKLSEYFSGNRYFSNLSFVLEDTSLKNGLPSTVADFRGSEFKILRQGSVKL